MLYLNLMYTSERPRSSASDIYREMSDGFERLELHEINLRGESTSNFNARVERSVVASSLSYERENGPFAAPMLANPTRPPTLASLSFASFNTFVLASLLGKSEGDETTDKFKDFREVE